MNKTIFEHQGKQLVLLSHLNGEQRIYNKFFEQETLNTMSLAYSILPSEWFI